MRPASRRHPTSIPDLDYEGSVTPAGELMDAAAWQPTVVRVDATNRITGDGRAEVPFRRSA